MISFSAHSGPTFMTINALELIWLFIVGSIKSMKQLSRKGKF